MGYIEIRVRMRSRFGAKITNGKSIIKDGVALTTYDDPKITENSFKAMQKQGKECELKKGILVERYDGMSKEEIADKIKEDVKKIQAKFKGIMDINYTRRVVKWVLK